MWSFQGTVQRRLWLRGLEASGEGWQQIGALTADGAQWGYAAGMSRAGVPWTWACRADSATVQWGGRRREVGTGPQGRRAAAGALGWGTREVQRCPPPQGDRRRPAIPQARYTSLPGGRGCGECRAPHPRTHSPRACSVRPWELPAESRAALAPSRPAARKVGGDGARELGSRRPPVALGRRVPCLAFARPQTHLSPAASATGNRGVHVIHRSPRPGPRPVGQRPGGVAACRMDPLGVRLPRARTPCGEHTGWKGVCEHGDVGAHTRCHTQCHGFVATAP